jgi:hypothetical protein
MPGRPAAVLPGRRRPGAATTPSAGYEQSAFGNIGGPRAPPQAAGRSVASMRVPVTGRMKIGLKTENRWKVKKKYDFINSC